jgi:lysozyme
MTQQNARPTKLQILTWLALILAIPAFFWYENNIAAFLYNRSQCAEPRRREWRSFDTPIPAGYAIHGIDVSHYSCEIDWEDVKKMNDNGRRVRFAYMRATRGLALIDYQFSKNWGNAQDANLRRGAYHFFTFTDDATQQANFFLKNVKFEKGDLPPVLDIEDDKKSNDRNLQKSDILRGIETWLRAIENSTGMRPMIYTNMDYYKRYINGNFPDYPIWIASYDNVRGVTLPDKKRWWFWQFSDEGRCNGISERIDLNVFTGNEAQLAGICKK